ncbi:MAG TPA: baseplate assembly protein [Desulfobacterales bacterium]|nr:baseplate assembly protein [Desulfobacterales bacterium]
MSQAVIDLTSLPAPEVIETLDYETILAAMLSDLRARDESFTAIVESDPVYKILEVAAYRELLLRQRVNDAARAVMLAFAGGGDLDHLGALINVSRLVIDPGDQDAIPPIAPTMESDKAFRSRCQMTFEGLSVAGPVGAYEFHALGASGQVKDVAVQSPAPGKVDVIVLSTIGDGAPDAALLSAVESAVNREDVRPLTDDVAIIPAEIVHYELSATLILYEEPDAGVVLAASLAAAQSWVANQNVLGHDITLSGLYAALHQSGVQKVILTSPTDNIVISPYQAAWCDAVNVVVGGRDE